MKKFNYKKVGFALLSFALIAGIYIFNSDFQKNDEQSSLSKTPSPIRGG